MKFLKVRVIVASLAVFACALTAPVAFAQPVPPPPETPVPIGAPAPANPDTEEIQAFASHVTVNKDGTITVTEQIDYWFPSLKHGIYRDIPVRYDIDGKLVEMPVTVESVTSAEGLPWTYVIQKNRDAIRIKIGDPDATISGAHSYVISYSVSGALRYFGDHDELYWNVTGNGWEVPIRKSAALVTLPDGIEANKITNRCFTGPAGSTAQDCLGRTQGNGVSFVAGGPLTVVVGWNKGVVATLLPKEIGFLGKPGKQVPFVLPIAVLIVMMAVWYKNGRDPAGRGTLMVQYEPPKGMSPAELAALCKEQVSTGDISAAIVHLAVRGYLQIAEVEKKGLIGSKTDYAFLRIKEYANDKTVLPFEKRILTNLFGDSMTARVSDIAENHTFYQEAQSISTEIMNKVVADGHFPISPTTVRGLYLGVGGLILFAIIFFGGGEGMFSGSLFGNIVAALAISAVIIMVIGYQMPRRTPKGVAAYAYALGFKDYLSTAEKYRLQWQEKEHVFESFLPYAMIFGVVDKWSKTFEGMQLPPQQWYKGSSMNSGMFNAVAFNGAMHSMSSSMNAALASRPASSSGGSGFGGSSGGGGGGGGGGSW